MLKKIIFLFAAVVAGMVFHGGLLYPFEIKKSDIYPKIITPNGDGRNDRLFIKFSNPYDNQLDAKIYTVNGCEIRTLPRDAEGTYFYWDGKDSGGETVFPGVYIIQVLGEGQAFNGVVIVAR